MICSQNLRNTPIPKELELESFNLYRILPFTGTFQIQNYFENTTLVQKLRHCKVGGWKKCGLCKGLELTEGGSVTNGAIPVSLTRYVLST